jgi:CRP-like cAMP-binding protein
LDNKLLASLPRDHFERLLPHLTSVQLPQGLVMFESGDEVDHVYFPHYGMLSLLAVLRDGKAIETATVGREGVVGAMAGLGLYKSLVRVVVQMPVACSKIAATHFRTVAAGSDPVRNLCIRYNEVLLSQARVTAACNALHSIEARFCRWLLQSADRAASDTVALTQEFLAEMLGVRRTSVTDSTVIPHRPGCGGRAHYMERPRKYGASPAHLLALRRSLLPDVGSSAPAARQPAAFGR